MAQRRAFESEEIHVEREKQVRMPFDTLSNIAWRWCVVDNIYPWAVYCEGPAAFIRCKKEGEGEEEKSFRREILWAVQNCIHKWNQTINFFWQEF